MSHYVKILGYSKWTGLEEAEFYGKALRLNYEPLKMKETYFYFSDKNWPHHLKKKKKHWPHPKIEYITNNVINKYN